MPFIKLIKCHSIPKLLRCFILNRCSIWPNTFLTFIVITLFKISDSTLWMTFYHLFFVLFIVIALEIIPCDLSSTVYTQMIIYYFTKIQEPYISRYYIISIYLQWFYFQIRVHSEVLGVTTLTYEFGKTWHSDFLPHTHSSENWYKTLIAVL